MLTGYIHRVKAYRARDHICQLQAILMNNGEYNQLAMTKQTRISQLQTEIATETAKETLDPMALGTRYSEIETICRELRNQATAYQTKNTAILTDPQKAKLQVLQDAVKLAPVISDAQSGNLIGSSTYAPLFFTSTSTGTTSGSVIGGHWVWSPRMQQLAGEEKIEAYVLPGGVAMQLFREIGAGRPGLFTHVGLGTFVDPRIEGGRMNRSAKAELAEVVCIDGRELLDQHHAAGADRRAQHAAHHCQHHRLDQDLADDLRAAGADRESHRDLTLASGAAREHQVGDIRAHDQQDHHHRREQHLQGRAQRSHGLLL